MSIWRRKFLVYPRFQLALVAANVIMMMILLAIVLVVLDSSMRSMSKGLSPDHPFYQFLQGEFGKMRMNFLLAGGGALLVSALFFVWFSHRVVGPIYGLVRYLRKHNDGEKLGLVRFRKSDSFHDLAQEINKALGKS